MKTQTILFLFALSVFSLATAPLRGASVSSSGTDFWLTFPAGAYPAGRKTSLIISGMTATSGTVRIVSLGYSRDFTVPSGGSTVIELPSSCQILPEDGMSPGLGIHVTSLEPVAVFGLSYRAATSDGYLGLPVSALGTLYVIQSYATNLGGIVKWGTEFAVVGTRNNTTVTIIPSVTTGARTAGVPYTVALNEGDVYQLENAVDGSDLTGTVVASDLPVAVFGGNQGADIPAGYYAANMLVEQLRPASRWGVEFFTVPLATRAHGDTFRYLAIFDGTTVFVNGAAVATLNQGRFFEQVLTSASYIAADYPICVMQFSNSWQTETGEVADFDPCMISVPAVNHYDKDYIVGMPLSGFKANFENIIAPDSAVGSILLDGVAIPAAAFTPIGSSGYSGAAVSVSVGTHRLTGPLDFGVIAYGFDYADAYGYPGGFLMSFCRLPKDTPTPRMTGTPSPTPTGKETPTHTQTFTVTGTPTVTRTPSVTDTPTATPTATPTDSPSCTPTASISPTPSATLSPSNTPTATPTPTVTNTMTVSLTPTASATKTPTVTESPALTPTATRIETPAATMTPTCVIRGWPNPYKLAEAVGGTFKVGCLPEGAKAAIYTLTGEYVNDATDVGHDMGAWDGKNRNGVFVSSGIYYYVVVKGGQVLKRDKFLVSR